MNFRYLGPIYLGEVRIALTMIEIIEDRMEISYVAHVSSSESVNVSMVDFEVLADLESTEGSYKRLGSSYSLEAASILWEGNWSFLVPRDGPDTRDFSLLVYADDDCLSLGPHSSSLEVWQ